MKCFRALCGALAVVLCSGCGGGEAGDECDTGADCSEAYYCLYRSPDDDLGECTAAPSGCTKPIGCGCIKALDACAGDRRCSGDDVDPATVKCE